MAGEAPAIRLGVPALLAHAEDDARNTKRVQANRVNQLQVGGSFGKVTITRNAQGKVAELSIEFEIDGETKTGTLTISRDGNGKVSEISELVLS